MEATAELSQFVESAIKSLCDKPNDVSVAASYAAGSTVCFIASCDSSDLAKVIGSKGKNINAIRTIISAIAAKHKIKSVLILKE